MSITKIKITNFRKISNLDIDTEGKTVVCFVGENGSSKTSVLSLILESLLFQSKYSFDDIQLDRTERVRLLSPAEIKFGENFYASEITFQNINKEKINYKKILLKNNTIRDSEYKNLVDIKVNIGRNYNEISNVKNLKDEFLTHNVLLERPSFRHEIYSMDLVSKQEMPISQNRKQLANVRPFKIKSISCSDNAQALILELLFDLYIGYKDRNWVLSEVQNILNQITGKEYGKLTVTSLPYRRIIFTETGDLLSLSQGELEILSTAISIIEQQIVLKNEYTVEINTFDISGVVLIDEIDLHLHPRAQEKYLKVLTNLFKNIQFIITTHSPFVVRGLPEESLVISLPSGKEYRDSFNKMDIDSITNIIFDYEGRFSAEMNDQFNIFKNLIIATPPDIDKLRDIYHNLKDSESAKNELDFYLSAYSQNTEVIKKITEN